MSLHRGDIVRAVKDIRAEPDLSHAVDLAVAHLITPCAAAAEAQVSRLTEALRRIAKVEYNRVDCELGSVSEHVEIAQSALASPDQEPKP